MALSNSCFGNLVVGFCVTRDEMCSVVKYDIIYDYGYTSWCLQAQVDRRGEQKFPCEVLFKSIHFNNSAEFQLIRKHFEKNGHEQVF